MAFVPVFDDRARTTFVASMFPSTCLSREVDVPETVERFSRRLPVEIIRMRRPYRSVGEVIVLVDGREPLFPLTFDYQRACRAIADRWGHDLVQFIALPSGVSGRFDSMHYGGLADLPTSSRLILLSDVVYQGWLSHQRDEQDYVQFNRSCNLYGHTLYHWRHVASAPNPTAVRALLAVLALVRSTGPHRLRILRQALNEAGIASSAADEIALWGHSERDSHQWSDWQHRLENRSRWVEYFDFLDKPVRDSLKRALGQFSHVQSPELRCVEQMLAATFGHGKKPASTPLRRLHNSVGQDTQGDAAAFLLSCMDCFAMAAPRFSQDPDYELVYSDLVSLMREHRVTSRINLHFQKHDQPASALSLIQQGSGLELIKDPGPRPVLHSANSVWMDDLQNTEITVGRVNTRSGVLSIRLAEGRLKAASITRPYWADELWRDKEGLFARSTSGQIAEATLDFDEKAVQRRSGSRSIVYAIDQDWRWLMVEATPDWASESGMDEYGLWAEFTTNTITQRLRWIPPGEFQMGSPEDEPKRSIGETLHHVTLTEGYWLADTSCTQALWEAVMGSNPSKFKGPDRPVETVSWNEVKDFIERLNNKVPGLQCGLPSEVQWEYAARAGSQSAFWWGSTLSAEQANYDGNYPYADGEKGQYRNETVAVKEFEANPWGLYQVHGNVMEWCEDWYGAYESGAAVNPRGAESGEWRVIRGGSWGSDGRWLRAAYRNFDGRTSAASAWASACAQVSPGRSPDEGRHSGYGRGGADRACRAGQGVWRAGGYDQSELSECLYCRGQ